jgi:hypothetical protein
MSKGLKYDTEKPDHSLFSEVWLDEVARVLTFGKNKYAADNWRKGIEQRRLIAAARRHINEFSKGEDLDSESLLNHLCHASCCLMFAYELLQTHPELDDRYKSPMQLLKIENIEDPKAKNDCACEKSQLSRRCGVCK